MALSVRHLEEGREPDPPAFHVQLGSGVAQHEIHRKQPVLRCQPLRHPEGFERVA
jgi:hypothetical protein